LGQTADGEEFADALNHGQNKCLEEGHNCGRNNKRVPQDCLLRNCKELRFRSIFDAALYTANVSSRKIPIG
jgi:hypothetical protein